MKNNQNLFWCLIAAYASSMAYQYYRYTLREHPADTFRMTELVGYSLFLSWSALSLVPKKWAVRAVLVLCAVQLSIGLFYYFPVIFPQRHERFWDWAEALTFMLLIGLAGYLAVQKLGAFKRAYSYR